jgi:predicted Zn-dependent protease
MFSFAKFSYVFAFFAVPFYGCNKSTLEETSETQHVVGQTSVQRKSPLKSCKEEAKSAYNPKLKLANAYLEKMIDLVVSENQKSAQTFRGFLDRTKFCSGVISSSSMQASGDPANGMLSATTGLLGKAQNDAEIAFALTHEMAHITLNNFLGTRTFENKIPKLEKASYNALANSSELAYGDVLSISAQVDAIFDVNPSGSYDENAPYAPQYRKLYEIALKDQKCKMQCEAFKTLGTKLGNAFEAYDTSEAKRKIMVKKYYSGEEIANKSESDADEVGLEFMARAGFDLSQATGFIGRARSTAPTSACVGKVFKRGYGAHPATCWRMQHIADEVKEHQKNYARFQVNAKQNIIAGPSLAEAKEEIAKFGN